MRLFLHWSMVQSWGLTSGPLFQSFLDYFLNFKVMFFWCGLGTKKEVLKVTLLVLKSFACGWWLLCPPVPSPTLFMWKDWHPSLIPWMALSCCLSQLFCSMPFANQANGTAVLCLLLLLLHTHDSPVKLSQFFINFEVSAAIYNYQVQRSQADQSFNGHSVL